MRIVLERFRALLVATAIFVFIAGVSMLADAAPEPPIYTGLVAGVAAGGYDPVAYFIESKAIGGRTDITLPHAGAVWRFTSGANRAAFKADPEKYAPQYGGYCAFAVANGYLAKGDPEQWTIVDQRLFLNYDVSVKLKWLKDPAGYIAKSDANWPGVLDK